MYSESSLRQEGRDNMTIFFTYDTNAKPGFLQIFLKLFPSHISPWPILLSQTLFPWLQPYSHILAPTLLSHTSSAAYPGGMEHNVGMAGMMTEQTGQTTSWLSRSPLNSAGFDWNLFLAQILFLLYSHPLMCPCCFLIVCH